MPEPPTGGVSGGVGAVQLPLPKLVTLKQDVYARYVEILSRAGYEQLARLGVRNAAEWNAERPGIAALAQQRTDELFDATFKTAKGRARVALLDELSKNLKPQQAAVNLRKRFRSVGRRQAYTAVATEVRDLVNLATLQAWQAIGMTHVRASDGHGGLTGRTDPTCEARNGKVYPIEAALTMTTGHDPTVHPRCTLGWIPVVPRGGLATTLAKPTGTGAAGTILIPEGVRLALLAAFNAEELRDWHGRWTKGGASRAVQALRDVLSSGVADVADEDTKSTVKRGVAERIAERVAKDPRWDAKAVLFTDDGKYLREGSAAYASLVPRPAKGRSDYHDAVMRFARDDPDQLLAASLIQGWAESSQSTRSLRLQAAVVHELGGEARQVRDGRDLAEEDPEQRARDAYRAFVRAIYEETQERLREFETLPVYRGLRAGEREREYNDRVYGGPAAPLAPPGRTGGVAIEQNPISSWTTDFSVAVEFAENGYWATMLRMEVPRDRVFSIPTTGIGALDEWELVLLQNEAEAVAYTWRGGEDAPGEQQLAAGRVTIDVDASLVNADWPKHRRAGAELSLALPDGAWRAEPHPRWPAHTPGVDSHGHSLAGEYMRAGHDVLDAIEAHIGATGDDVLDMSFLASGAHHIRSVHVRGVRGALLFSVEVEDTGSGREANVGLAWLDGEDLDPARLRDALEQIDAGMPITDVAHAVEERDVAAQVVSTDAYRAYAQAVNPQSYQLSDRFQVDQRRRADSRTLRQIAKRVFAAVDKVHTHDAPPSAAIIAILADRNLDDEGQMVTYAGGAPIEINVNPDGDQPYLTLAHELGHYTDRQIIGRDFFASDPNLHMLTDTEMVRLPDDQTPTTDAAVRRVLDAIEATDAVTTLRGMERQTEPTIVERRGQRHEVMPNQAYVQYNLFPWELFARAYSQWIALRSGDGGLIHDHAEFQEGGGYAQTVLAAHGIHYPRQWEWHDFAPVAAAMDDLFADKGFLRDGVRGADPAGLLTPPAPVETPGAWPERGLAWQRRWDALPDDQPVWLFHATTPEHADTLLREGSDPATKPRSLARQRYEAGEHATFQPGAGLSSGLTVGQTPWDVSGYGRRLLAVQVPKGWVKVSPEQAALGETSPGGALRVNDAVVDQPVPASAFREIDTRGRTPGPEVFDRLTGGGGGGAAPPGPALPPSVNPALIGHVNDWSQSRPWERPKADYVAGQVPGFTYAPDGGPGVAARMPAGSDTVHIFDGAFDHATGKPDSLLMYHEAGHAVANVILQRQNGLQKGNDVWKVLEPWYHPTTGYQGAQNHKWRNPWLNPYGETPSYSDNPEEILAEAYAQLIHGDLDRRYTYVPGLDGPPGEGFTPDELAAKAKWRDLYEFVAAAAADMGLPSTALWKLERGPNGETMTVPAKPQGDLAPVPAPALELPGDAPFSDPASGWKDYYDEGRVVEGLNLRRGDQFTFEGNRKGARGTTVYEVVALSDPDDYRHRAKAKVIRGGEANGLETGDTIYVGNGDRVYRTYAYPGTFMKVGDQARAVEADTGRYVKLARYKGSGYHQERETYRVGGWTRLEGKLMDGTPFYKWRRVLTDQHGNHSNEDMDTVLTYARKPRWAAQQEREQAERAARNTPTDLSTGAYVNYLTGEHRAVLQGMVFNQGAEPLSTDDLKRSLSEFLASPPDKGVATDYMRALQQMPAPLLQILKDGGVKVYLGAGYEKITDLDEQQSKENQQPRGWTPGSKMWQTGGYYTPGLGWVFVGNGKRDGSRSVLLHELGHAIGDKMRVDDNPDLKAHHARLKSGLQPYYSGAAHQDTATDPDAAGRQELWAEAVAVYLAAGGDGPAPMPLLKPWETPGFLALLRADNGIGKLDAKYAAYVEDKLRALAGLQPVERPPDALLDPAIRHAISFLDDVPVGGRIRAGRGRDFQDYYVRVEGGWHLTAFYDDGRQLVVAQRVIPSSEIADWFSQEPRKLEVS